jgi:hypothetical protein
MVSLTELKAKQHQIMGNIVSRIAQEMQVRLVEETRKVAAKIKDAVVLTPPGPKALETARAKVNKEYGGDWLEIKDMARCTLVVSTPLLLDAAVIAVRAQFRASNGFTVIEEKVTVGALNSAGYSGLTIFVESGGNKGEIQINTPALMYAKSLPEFIIALPGQEALMKATYPLVPGGLGHELYETHRDTKKQPEAKRRAYGAASKLYYNYFRSYPPNMNWGMMARDAINALHLGHA